MTSGLVYAWTADPGLPLGGSVAKVLVDLGPLDREAGGMPALRNARVEVRNGGKRYRHDPYTDRYAEAGIGNAAPNSQGEFRFEPGKGGGRLDKYPHGPEDFQQRYIEASRFGEVNSFYHLDRIAAYAEELLGEIGEGPLPRVIAVVNAHHAVTGEGSGKDGLHKKGGRCHPLQGGHYRLPASRHTVCEHFPLAETGEIHLGPGRKLVDGGALPAFAGGPYRANASHNAGIIYHEYGHHICRHTADFRANTLRRPARQDNVKSAIDEGLCDYWTAAMLGTPHIWAFHKHHDEASRHPRSLASTVTMDDYDHGAKADPHLNGTIWGAALWDLRCAMAAGADRGARDCDLLVMKALVLTGRLFAGDRDAKATMKLRSAYETGLEQLIAADAALFQGRNAGQIASVFEKRKIRAAAAGACSRGELSAGLRRLPEADIPASEDIMSGGELADLLARAGVSDYSAVVVGDIMLGDRMDAPIATFGEDYPFAGVQPVFGRAAIVCGNLEGPFAAQAEKQDRNFSYRVDPRRARMLKRANINVMTLANNHLLDCGREGVTESIEALRTAGVHWIGAGVNEAEAHAPVILDAGDLRVGLLGYYWNRRCAATAGLAGSAMDTPEWLAADIAALRRKADRVIAVFHWGVPYEREPSPEDRAKARLAVDLGADLVVGHHPHVIQPFEIYKGVPIFYSAGNFAFGSGNSRAESLMVAARFGIDATEVDVYPVYVKNRDPRANYQPKVLRGPSGRRVLERLAALSGDAGASLSIQGPMGRMCLRRTEMAATGT